MTRAELDAAVLALRELLVLAEHGGWVLADDHSLGLVNEPAVARARAAVSGLLVHEREPWDEEQEA